jgi:hypothetical protein
VGWLGWLGVGGLGEVLLVCVACCLDLLCVAGRKLENEKRAVHSHRHSYIEQVQIIIAWYISQTLPQPPTTA